MNWSGALRQAGVTTVATVKDPCEGRPVGWSEGYRQGIEDRRRVGNNVGRPVGVKADHTVPASGPWKTKRKARPKKGSDIVRAWWESDRTGKSAEWVAGYEAAIAAPRPGSGYDRKKAAVELLPVGLDPQTQKAANGCGYGRISRRDALAIAASVTRSPLGKDRQVASVDLRDWAPGKEGR